MHITITGNLGSGKSTICKILNKKYDFEIYSTGKVQRQLAQEMGMTTLELNQLMRKETKYDHMIDDATARISRENQDKDIVFDSRLAWHFVEKSFKVFVSVSLEEAARRVMGDDRGETEKYDSFEEAVKLLAKRAATENVRYKEIYNLNYMDFSNYDLIIDSTYSSPELIAEIILKEAKKHQESPFSKTKTLVSGKRLSFEESFEEEDHEEIKLLADKYKKDPYNIEDIVKVKKSDDNYIVVDGHKYVKASVLADIAYIPIDFV